MFEGSRRKQKRHRGATTDLLNYFSICRTSLEIGADGETCTPVGHYARQFTKLMLSLLSHIGEMVIQPQKRMNIEFTISE